MHVCMYIYIFTYTDKCMMSTQALIQTMAFFRDLHHPPGAAASERSETRARSPSRLYLLSFGVPMGFIGCIHLEWDIHEIWMIGTWIKDQQSKKSSENGDWSPQTTTGLMGKMMINGLDHGVSYFKTTLWERCVISPKISNTWRYMMVCDDMWWYVMI